MNLLLPPKKMTQMKIGIFGDSFAAPKYDHPLNDTATTWVECLGKNYYVKTFGINGASLFYSMQLFLKNHHLFDRNIFAITNPHRFVIPDHKQVLPKHMRFICGLNSVEIFEAAIKNKTQKNKKEILELLNHAKNYIIHVQDKEFNEYAHNLLMDQIKRIRPDTILVPCFYDSLIELDGSLPLAAGVTIENDAWGISAERYSKLMIDHVDIRPTHFTEENNMMLAEKINECLQNNSKFTLQQNDVILPKISYTRYIIPLNTI